MKTAILVGGKGTRIFSAQTAVPKALYEIGNRPILWHIMKLYAHQGFCDFLLLLGYRAEQIVDYVANRAAYEDRDILLQVPATGRPQIINGISDDQRWNVTLCHTGLDTEKGERLRKIRPYVEDDEHFMVTYGDGLSDIDIQNLIEFHKSHGKVATLTVVQARSQFGHVDFNASGKITEMIENPVLPKWINGGFMIFSRRIFDWLEPNDPLESGAIRRLAAAGELMAYRHDGFWACMDTYKDTLRLDEMWKTGEAPWKKW